MPLETAKVTQQAAVKDQIFLAKEGNIYRQPTDAFRQRHGQ